VNPIIDFGNSLLLTMLLDGMLTATLSHIIEVEFTDKINVLGIVVGAATLAGFIEALRWGIGPFIVPKLGACLINLSKKISFYPFS
jgi:hypothetical protein